MPRNFQTLADEYKLMEEKLERAHLTKNPRVTSHSRDASAVQIKQHNQPRLGRLAETLWFQIYFTVHFPTKIKKLAKNHSQENFTDLSDEGQMLHYKT